MNAVSRKYKIRFMAICSKTNGWHGKQHGDQKWLFGSFENALVGDMFIKKGEFLKVL